ncbi:MAG TPA: hypothetical protein VLT33_29605, partial [Labilithrix sp.]|nr:hypothetical protein [Labilithrix sp.]
AVRSKMQRFDEVTRTLQAGGSSVAVLAAALRSHGDPLACGAPDQDASAPDEGAGATYRLSLVDDVVTLERRRADGAFEAVAV